MSPKVIISDGNAAYSCVIDEINKYRSKEIKIKHVLCTFHVLWDINKHFRGYRRLKLAPRFEVMKQLLHKAFEADTLSVAEKTLDSALARAYEFKGTRVEPVFEMLAKNRDRLFPFLKYGINRTNNPVEHYNGFVKRFQHVSWKFPTLEGVRNLLSVYALFYNFMPKMEGKNKGVSPLEKAGLDGPKDMYVFINYPRCVSLHRPENHQKNKMPPLNMNCPASGLRPATA